MRLLIECAGRQVEYPLTEGVVVVGRDNTCDICFPETSLSRRHLMCTLRGQELAVRDLNSKNGTFLGPQRIQEARLVPGVRLRAGNCFLSVLPEADEAATGEVAGSGSLRLRTEGEGAALPPGADLESMVPDDEHFAEEEEPTPVDESLAESMAADGDDGARLLVRDGRWLVQDPATGVEVEIVPLQGAPAAGREAAALPVLRAAGEQTAMTPALREGNQAGMPALFQPALPATMAQQGPVGRLLSDPKKWWYLIGAIALIAVLAVSATLLLKSKPPPPPISVGAYRSELNRAIAQYARGESQQALAALAALRKKPMNFKPIVAEMLAQTITADTAMAKDFAAGYGEAQKQWKEVRDDSKTPEELRKIAGKRVRWIGDEEGNLLSLNEAKQYAAKGDYARARAYATNVSADSMFYQEAAPIITQARNAVMRGILDRAEAAFRTQKWQDAVAAYQEAIDNDDGLAETLKPKIALSECYEREREAYQKAGTLAGQGRHADALRQLNSIATDSPYAKNAASLRAQCQATGSNQAALAAYNAGNGEGALDILDKAGLKSGGLYSKIQRVQEKRKDAWEAMKEGKFQTAENAWKTITGLENNKDNFYVKEALRELQYIPERKKQMSEQFVTEAHRLLEQFQYKAARARFVEALLLNSANQGAVDGLNQLRARAQREHNLAFNEWKTNPKKALVRLQIAADCLSPTDSRFQDIEILVKRIKDEMNSPAQ